LLRFHRNRFMDSFRPTTNVTMESTSGGRLSRKRWDELSPEVVFHISIALPTVGTRRTDSVSSGVAPAFRGDLPSREYGPGVHAVLPLSGKRCDGWDENRIAEIVGLFDVAQRKVVDAIPPSDYG
jgi:hypothetical protein